MSQSPKKRLSREEVAKREIGQTDVSPALARTLVAVFLFLIIAVPVVQFVHEAMTRRTARTSQFDLVRDLPAVAEAFRDSEASLWGRTLGANARLLQAIHRYEETLDNASILTGLLLGPSQVAALRLGGLGNEKAYPGRDGWLFYRPGVDYLTGPGFLSPAQLARRRMEGSEYATPPQPDPVAAILDFRDRLAQWGVDLVVMPTPVKPSIYPDMLSGRYDVARLEAPLQNVSYRAFMDLLEAEGVRVFDPAPMLLEWRRQALADDGDAAAPLYLETDSHWTPAAMEQTAAALAAYLEAEWDLGPATGDWRREAVEVAALGDIALMMNLPEDQGLYTPQSVAIGRIVDGAGALWRPSQEAAAMVLGDSFSNIFSLGDMGWGDGGGLVEHLSFHLGRPVDRITRNDNGAFATRQALSVELARGRDRLSGKQVVVWQFAARELAVGDWRIIALEAGEAHVGRFLTPPPGEPLVVQAELRDISAIPNPGSVPYADHIAMLHLTDLEGVGKPLDGDEAVAYIRTMRGNVWTAAARFRPGDRLTLRLQAWADVAERYDAINRSELDDLELQLVDPCWAEEVTP